MLISRVSVEVLEIRSESLRLEEAVLAGQSQNLVACCLDSSGLVDVDVPGVYCYDSFNGSQEKLDDCGVSLSASDEEEDFGVGAAKCGADELLCVV